jgi:anti-anti-sigma factor
MMKQRGCSIFAAGVGSNLLLHIAGSLDTGSYRRVRDAVVKATLDGPAAVIVDVDEVTADTPAWSVFAAARWQTSRDDVAILLACNDWSTRRLLDRVGVSRYVPVYASVEAAMDAVAGGRIGYCRRARIELERDESSLGRVRVFAGTELTMWSMTEHIPAVSALAELLVERALRHSPGACAVRIEADDRRLTVAVDDGAAEPAVLPASVEELCSAWGSAPGLAGNTVWASIALDHEAVLPLQAYA